VYKQCVAEMIKENGRASFLGRLKCGKKYLGCINDKVKENLKENVENGKERVKNAQKKLGEKIECLKKVLEKHNMI